MADTNETSNYILTDEDWDQLIATVDVEQSDRDEAEANLRAENWLRANLGIPKNIDVIDWETVAWFPQKQADRNKERIEEQKEHQQQIELYLQEIRDSRERELYIIELYEKYGPMGMEP